MYANQFRRIALAQGLLPGTPASPPPPVPAATQAGRAPEPCEARDKTA